MDLNNLFGDAQKAVEQGMNDLLKTGGNSALGYLEGEAVKVLQEDKKRLEGAAQAGVKEILSRPTQEGSFGDYLKGVFQSPILQTYGTPLILVVGCIAAGAVFLYRR